MPVILYTNPSEFSKQTCGKECAAPSAACLERSSRNLSIGLINNMPDSALEATERQFALLLDAASGGITVRLHFYSLPGVPRSGTSAARVNELYSSTENLLGSHLDGLIVTGREPTTPSLKDEPYWKSFRVVLDWARNHTHSAVWSCLAAHAAVLHQDGIQRVRSKHKHFGIFSCERLGNHPLTEGISPNFKVPHSRWNGLREEDLTTRGYNLLSRSADAGVDMFIKQHKSLFVFFQGHPEYESNTPLLEYRRDVGRFLRREIDNYPLMPLDYFDVESQASLTALERDATANRREELLKDVTEALETVRLQHNWRSSAARVYGNWLQYICAQKLCEMQAANVTRKNATLDAIETYAVEPKLTASFETGQAELVVLP